MNERNVVKIQFLDKNAILEKYLELRPIGVLLTISVKKFLTCSP